MRRLGEITRTVRWPAIALAAMIAARTIGLSSLCHQRYFTFHSYWPIDLANINQAIWNAAHGRPQKVTILYDGLREHFDHLLMALSPVYWFSDSIFWVFFFYSLIISSGILAVYLLAKREISGEVIPLLLALQYAVFPFLVRLNIDQLRGDLMAVPMLLFAYFFYSEKRFRLFIFFIAGALLCKESVAAPVVIWGLYALIQRRSSKWVLLPILSGLGVLAFTMWIYNPMVLGIQYRHTHLGGLPENLGLGLFLDGASWIFLFRTFFAHGGLISVLSPVPLLMAAPLLGPVFVWPGLLQHPMWYHVLVPTVAFVMVSMVGGTERLLSFFSDRRAGPAVVFGVLLVGVVLMVFQAGSSYRWYRQSDEDRAIWSLIDQIPRDAFVAAPPLVLPALSGRDRVHSLVMKKRRGHDLDPMKADFVLLNVNEVIWSKTADAPNVKKLDSLYFSTIDEIRTSSDFDRIERKRDWELYRRIAP
ncbi:MAG: DUF2079 domain-containing protein [Thermoanaerobaculales bacterium]|nr:DUF2079 domain-containing protein [Thermoanaerobaculales bacterium]